MPKPKRVSSMQRSLKHMRERGYLCGITERFLMFTKQRQDLFGCIDFIAIHPIKKETIGVQTTSKKQVWSHKDKYLTDVKVMHNLTCWLNSGNKFEIHGWYKKDNRIQVQRIECVSNDTDLIWRKIDNDIGG